MLLYVIKRSKLERGSIALKSRMVPILLQINMSVPPENPESSSMCTCTYICTYYERDAHYVTRSKITNIYKKMYVSGSKMSNFNLVFNLPQ